MREVHVVKYYRHVPTQIVILLLFQVLMLIDFTATKLGLLGAYILCYVFCMLWGNVGYLVLSNAVFCLITVWFCNVDGFRLVIDLYFWYLLFTLVPSMLVVFLRNALIARFRT